jgi:hypothetical protein
LFGIPDDKRRFLDAGHYLQEAVEAFLEGSLPAAFSLKKDWREIAGTYNHEDRWVVTGHVDGVLVAGNRLGLLEVKAIKNASFNKLAKADHWQDVYGHYVYQAQTYLHCTYQEFKKKLMGTYFVFYNRDTSELMGGFDIDSPGYTYRPDMYEKKDDEVWESVVKKFDRACTHLTEETEPEGCDAEGYCYFCGTRGTGSRLRREKRVGLMKEDMEWVQIASCLSDITEARDTIRLHFEKFNADVIKLPTGTVLRKADYE